MKLANNTAKAVQQLHKGIQHQSLAQIYPDYKLKHEELLRKHWEEICAPLIGWSSEKYQQLPYEESIQIIQTQNPISNLSTNLDILLQQYEELKNQPPTAASTIQRTHPIIKNLHPVKLFSETFKTPLEAFNQVARNQQLPQFIPFMSSFPHTQIVEELRCQENQESQIDQLSSKWDGAHPYQKTVESTQQIEFFQRYFATLKDEPIPEQELQQLFREIHIHAFQIKEHDTKVIQTLHDNMRRYSGYQLINAFQGIVDPEIAVLYHFLYINLHRLCYVSTASELEKLVDVLNQQIVFAIDVEHSERNYYGATSLMQITLENGEDYIIDCLSLSASMHLLRAPLANPSIMKVLHGGFNDVLWLERDFRLYLVNVFDTFLASKHIRCDGRGLDRLLFHIMKVQISKDQQLSDWSLRPLTLEQQQYARQDSHFLLYLAHQIFKQIPKQSLAEFENQLQELQLSSFAERLEKQTSSLFISIKQSENIQQLELCYFDVFVDCLARFHNIHPSEILMNMETKLVQESSKLWLAIKRGDSDVAKFPFIKLHLQDMPRIVDYAADSFRHLQNIGQFNQLSFKDKEPLKNQIHPIQNLNWAKVLKEIGWGTSDQDNVISCCELSLSGQSVVTRKVEEFDIVDDQKCADVLQVKQIALSEALKGYLK